MRNLVTAVFVLTLNALSDVHAQIFSPLAEQPCITNPSAPNLFTTGGQYVDPNNGVIPDSWSMLMRWQGNIGPVTYQLGDYTKFLVPVPVSTFQHGWAELVDPTGTPGTQLYCKEGGSLLNTWPIRHNTVQGGGYNNMFGYSWSPENAPRAFRTAIGEPADLVIQMFVAAPWIGQPHLGSAAPAGVNLIDWKNRLQPALDIAMFAYLRDTTHPTLHDIAIVASLGANPRRRVPGATEPPASELYTNNYLSHGFVSRDYGPDQNHPAGGVWFASGAVRTSSNLMTVNYTDGKATYYPGYHDSPNEPYRFYRVHISPRNLVEIINGIEAVDCSANTCPSRGYSRNPADYQVVYAGLIHEMFMHDGSQDPLTTPPDQLNKPEYDQFSSAIKFHDVGIFRSTPSSSFKSGVVIRANSYYAKILGRFPELNGPTFALPEPVSDPVGIRRDDFVDQVLAVSGDTPKYVQVFREKARMFFASAEYSSRGRSISDFLDDVLTVFTGALPGQGVNRTFWLDRLQEGMPRYEVVNNFLTFGDFYKQTTKVVLGVEEFPRSTLLDYTGDGRADFLFRNTNSGQVFRFSPEGLAAYYQYSYVEGNTAWNIVGEGDFDGDGKADALYRNETTGAVVVAFLTSTGQAAAGPVVYTEPSSNWEIVGTPDIDGDGKSDILWWNRVTGQVYLLLMNGSSVKAQNFVYVEGTGKWRIVATGDFAGSGKRNQVLWRNTEAASPQLFLQTITYNGGNSFSESGAIIYTAGSPAWKVLSAGDFDGDGKSDILYFNESTRQIYILLMNGYSVQSQGFAYLASTTDWKVVTTGDYDGNGRADVLLRNESTGQLWVLYMNGISVASEGPLYSEPNLAWKIVGAREFGLANGSLD